MMTSSEACDVIPRDRGKPIPFNLTATSAASICASATSASDLPPNPANTMSTQGLFSDSLISPEVAAALPEGYIVRALRPSDYAAGHLDVLRVLTTVGDISEEAWKGQYEWMTRQDGTYYILVIEDSNIGKVVGTGALIVERKLFVSLSSPTFPGVRPS